MKVGQARLESRPDHSDDLFETQAIVVVKRSRGVRVEIEHGRDLPLSVEDRHHDLRASSRIAGDVPREGADVLDNDRLSLGRRGSADATIKRDLQTGRRPLIGADPQQSRFDDSIETGPAHDRETLVNYGAHARHHRDGVGDAFEQGENLALSGLVEVGL